MQRWLRQSLREGWPTSAKRPATEHTWPPRGHCTAARLLVCDLKRLASKLLNLFNLFNLLGRGWGEHLGRRARGTVAGIFALAAGAT